MFAARATSLVKLVGLCLMAGVLVAALLFPVIGGMGLASNRAADTVDKTSGELTNAELPLVTTVLDMNGQPIAYLYDQYRIPVASKDISDTMKAAIIAIEDKRFFLHKGVDWQGIARAAAKAGVDGGASQGASTLTQQYVKNYLAFVVGKGEDEAYEKATEATLGRKISEARIATQLEQKMTKDEILTAYLNLVPFGNGTYGVGAAARAYFDTTPDKLTVPQAAMLAGLVNEPSRLNPGADPEPAIKRRNTVIDKMRENGAFGSDDKVAKEKADEYKATDIGVVADLRLLPNGCVGAGDGPIYGFFCRYLIDYLERSGLPFEELRRGGYTVHTTMDPVATRATKEAAESQVPKTAPGIANAMAVVQPGQDKHRVRALAANRDFGNNADAGQSAFSIPAEVTKFGAGSIYKVFTAASALERNVTGIDRPIEVPNTYTSKVYKNGSQPYTVKNAGTYKDRMSLTEALATSPNTGFIILEEKTGLDNVVDMAYRLGLRDSMQGVNEAGDPLKQDGSNGPSQGDSYKRNNSGSFTLGAGPTSVLELANVSATLVSGGKWCPPTPVEKIVDRDGQDVALKEAPCDQAVAPEIANAMVTAMSQDVKGVGTAAGAARDWDRPMLGKTGTTENHWSVAFMGATMQFAGAVMTFTDGVRPQVICNGTPPRLCGNNDAGGVFGGQVAAPTWFRAMRVIHGTSPVQPLPAVEARYR
ncbi:transglycosylase domain-containing protein [Saccharothrix violaceirubra]|uniref:Membrane peptidoglycan carboxypeptidase n=1 Tax=Saccharothrix violaceirubra TaxID=413306 RepID=A0A7W7T1A5_9PSEU|nr:transglycosylase domain-containing protein [Saccharothrix violaceirubra]MBB4964718.1 membrane peptidoglycan carboxypeptidase [Saccharothrix violaceirubra]